MTEQDRLMGGRGGVRVRRERSKGRLGFGLAVWADAGSISQSGKREGGVWGGTLELCVGSATSEPSARMGGEKLGK